MNKISHVIGNRIKSLRVAQKLSQEKLAEMSGLHSTYIGQIERGEKCPTVDSIYKISVGLKIPMYEIFKNIVGEKHDEIYADKIYDLVVAMSNEKQKCIYDILKQILLL